MSPALKQTYMVIDEWWKKYGYAPTIDEIMFITGERGRGNVSRKINMLIKLGVCKGIPGRSRTVRPSYLRVHRVE